LTPSIIHGPRPFNGKLFAYYSDIAANERLDVPTLGERAMALLAEV
jgi:hypothetical protein